MALALRFADRRRMELARWLDLGRPAASAGPGPSPAAVRLARSGRGAQDLAAVWILICVASQVLVENRAVPAPLRPERQPEAMAAVIQYLRIPQGWGMFAPDAPVDDATLVVDATLNDGTHIDPLTGAPPDFDAPYHGPWKLDLQWGELKTRIRNAPHLWSALRAYLMRIPDLERWPRHRWISRLDVYAITNGSPPPGSTVPTRVERKLLFTRESAL